MISLEPASTVVIAPHVSHGSRRAHADAIARNDCQLRVPARVHLNCSQLCALCASRAVRRLSSWLPPSRRCLRAWLLLGDLGFAGAQASCGIAGPRTATAS